MRNVQTNRTGAVTVEFAITAPILFLLVLGAIEFSRANMLMHSATVAATEAVRKAIIPGASSATVRATAEQELSYVGVSAADIFVEPAVITDDTTLVTVGVNVPMNAANGYVVPKFFVNKDIQKVVSLPREAKNDPQMTQEIAEANERMLDTMAEAAAAERQQSSPANSNTSNATSNSGSNSGSSNSGSSNSGRGNSGSNSGQGSGGFAGWLRALLGL